MARSMGCRVKKVRRTGEIRVSHDLQEKSVKVNERRKDAPRALTTWLKRLDEKLV
jgi:hypothetical protein